MDLRCPHCGAVGPGDATELGLLGHCARCGLDWAETLALDFRTD